MKLQMKFLPVYTATLCALIMGCAGIQPGNDPVVVNAERTTAVARDSFDSFLQYEYNNKTTLQNLNPNIHKFANKIRKNGVEWLQSARSMTQAYKYNRNDQNKANLQTAVAVLQEAVNQIRQYMTEAGGPVPQASPAG